MFFLDFFVILIFITIIIRDIDKAITKSYIFYIVVTIFLVFVIFTHFSVANLLPMKVKWYITFIPIYLVDVFLLLLLYFFIYNKKWKPFIEFLNGSFCVIGILSFIGSNITLVLLLNDLVPFYVNSTLFQISFVSLQIFLLMNYVYFSNLQRSYIEID
eukprot:TRINITY_DN9218_c0_g1_i1.p2 TRINITY_DN9218_c0_g1~~TRINITY_DN9218_c0_g1_i1.p2  ORF type:complete len:158 (-),score=31.50 TRINITY_DN9218_c0_g1_i1:69-542(-)